MGIGPSALEGVGLTGNFWLDKTVLLTGHTGFKGSWLSLWLQKLGARVVGYSLAPPTDPNLFEIARVGADMVSVFGDVRDLAKLTDAFKDHRPEIIIHMAAQALVRQSYRSPVETYGVNVMGTVHVLEAARRCRSAAAVIIVTSDKCYENRERGWPYREDDPLGGADPYSSSKACAELVSAAYRRSLFPAENSPEPAPRLATVRGGNVIGGGDWAADRLVPDCIRAFVDRRPVTLRYPTAARPWQHVLELLAGYMGLAERLQAADGHEFSEAWNFGPYREKDATVGDVVGHLCELWGDDASVTFTEQKDLLCEANLLRLDSTKAAHRLGWRQRWDLPRSLQETVAWYRAWLSGEDMRSYTLRQISSYEDEA